MTTAYADLTHAVSDTRQSLRAARRDVAATLKQRVESATGDTTLSDELTELIADLAELDPQAHGMSTAEYAYSLLLVYYQELFESRYVGIDMDNREGVTFVIQPVVG